MQGSGALYVCREGSRYLGRGLWRVFVSYVRDSPAFSTAPSKQYSTLSSFRAYLPLTKQLPSYTPTPTPSTHDRQEHSPLTSIHDILPRLDLRVAPDPRDVSVATSFRPNERCLRDEQRPGRRRALPVVLRRNIFSQHTS